MQQSDIKANERYSKRKRRKQSNSWKKIQLEKITESQNQFVLQSYNRIEYIVLCINGKKRRNKRHKSESFGVLCEMQHWEEEESEQKKMWNAKNFQNIDNFNLHLLSTVFSLFAGCHTMCAICVCTVRSFEVHDTRLLQFSVPYFGMALLLSCTIEMTIFPILWQHEENKPFQSKTEVAIYFSSFHHIKMYFFSIYRLLAFDIHCSTIAFCIALTCVLKMFNTVDSCQCVLCVSVCERVLNVCNCTCHMLIAFGPTFSRYFLH